MRNARGTFDDSHEGWGLGFKEGWDLCTKEGWDD